MYQHLGISYFIGFSCLATTQSRLMNSLSLQTLPIASKNVNRNRSQADEFTRQIIHFLPVCMPSCLLSPFSHYELEVIAKFTDVIKLWFGPYSGNYSNAGRHFGNSYLFVRCAGIISVATYEGNSLSKLQIVIEKNRMEIMTYKQHLFFNIISIQI